MIRKAQDNTTNNVVLGKSLIGLDFLINKTPPSINNLLDYRSRIKALKEIQEYPDQCYQNEIDAVDEILRNHKKTPNNPQ